MFDYANDTRRPDEYEEQYITCPNCNGDCIIIIDEEADEEVVCPKCKGEGDIAVGSGDDGQDDAAYERSRNK